MSPIADIPVCGRSTTRARTHRVTAADIGAIIRERRRKLGLDQGTLARRVGVGREWIVDVEKGKPRAGIELVLRTLAALGLSLDVSEQARPYARTAKPGIDLDRIVARARRTRR
jgi:HTH-type transcriptional regulator/antitoxin HipB